MNIILSDLNSHKKFLPLSYTRSIADFRVGILTIKEKWEKYLESRINIKTEEYLQAKYELKIEKSNTIIYSAVLPNQKLVDAILSLKNSKLVKNNILLAYNTDLDIDTIPDKTLDYKSDITIINGNTDLFTLNGICIEDDFELLTKGRISASLNKTNTVFGKHPVFVGNNCFVECTQLIPLTDRFILQIIPK